MKSSRLQSRYSWTYRQHRLLEDLVDQEVLIALVVQDFLEFLVVLVSLLVLGALEDHSVLQGLEAQLDLSLL